jgi:DNA invertase Pin-like site-specific DNA recombinase
VAAGDDADEVVERGSFRALVRALDSGAYGVLVVVSLDRGARNDADAGLLIEVLRRHGIVVLESGRALDVRVQADKDMVRVRLLMAAMHGDHLATSTQRTRLQNALAGDCRLTLPSGLVYASPSDPEYVRRLRAAGLGSAVTEEALARHQVVTSREGVRVYTLPFPDADVWQTVVLRVRWMRRLQDVQAVAECIQRGYGPVAGDALAGDAPADAADGRSGAPGAATAPDAARPDAGGAHAEHGAPATDATAASAATSRANAEPEGLTVPESGAGGAETDPARPEVIVAPDPWADDRWPAAYVGRIPVIRHNFWRHQTAVRWVRVTVKTLGYWYASRPLYGEYQYTAHGLRAGAADPDAPAPVARHAGAFPAPAGPDDQAMFLKAAARATASRRAPDDRGPRQPSDYVGARAHAVAHAYCAHPFADREGTVRRSGPRAGLPANRSPRAPQGFDACGLHLNPWYTAAGLRGYASVQCGADRGHAGAVTVVLDEVVVATVLAAVQPATVREAVAAWHLAARMPDAELEALRGAVTEVRALRDGAVALGTALFASGNAAGGQQAVASVNAHDARLAPLEARLAAAERAADVDAEVTREDWTRVQRLASVLPSLVAEARAADRALDAALRAAYDADDAEQYAALAAHEGQVRALLDVLGVSVEVTVPAATARAPFGRGGRDEAPAGAPLGLPVPDRVPADAADDPAAVDAGLLAAAAGSATWSPGQCRVVVRFPNGARYVRYADLAYHAALQPERVWAYARLAAAAPSARDGVAAAVAAALSRGDGVRARGRKPRAVLPWSAAQVRAAAVQYAVHEFGRPIPDGPCAVGDGDPCADARGDARE